MTVLIFQFRLKKCGLRYPMYLVEDYGSMQHFSLPEKTIKQAITNTQVTLKSISHLIAVPAADSRRVVGYKRKKMWLVLLTVSI